MTKMMWRVTCCCPLASPFDGLLLNSKCFGLRTSPRVLQLFLMNLSSKTAQQTIFLGSYDLVFMHLADAFIQSDLQCIQAIIVFSRKWQHLGHFLIPQGGTALANMKLFPAINCGVTLAVNAPLLRDTNHLPDSQVSM